MYLHTADVQFKHQDLLNSVVNLDARVDKLVELNVIEQVANLVNTTVLQDAWDRGQKLNVHACVYGLNDGLLRYHSDSRDCGAACRSVLCAVPWCLPSFGYP